MRKIKNLSERELVNLRHYPHLNKWYIVNPKENQLDEKIEEVMN